MLCALLDHPGIAGLISGVLGEDFNYASGDGNYYSGDTGWHSDGSWGQLWAAKTAFYLDSVTKDSGCLRVIPGSHRPDHYLRAKGISPNDAQERFGVAASDFPGSLALESNPGDPAGRGDDSSIRQHPHSGRLQNKNGDRHVLADVAADR